MIAQKVGKIGEWSFNIATLLLILGAFAASHSELSAAYECRWPRSFRLPRSVVSFLEGCGMSVYENRSVHSKSIGFCHPPEKAVECVCKLSEMGFDVFINSDSDSRFKVVDSFSAPPIGYSVVASSESAIAPFMKKLSSLLLSVLASFFVLYALRTYFLFRNPFRLISTRSGAGVFLMDERFSFPRSIIRDDILSNLRFLISKSREEPPTLFSLFIGFIPSDQIIHRVYSFSLGFEVYAMIYVRSFADDIEFDCVLQFDEAILTRDDVQVPIAFPVSFSPIGFRSPSVVFRSPIGVGQIYCEKGEFGLLSQHNQYLAHWQIYMQIIKDIRRLSHGMAAFQSLLKQIFDSFDYSAVSFYSERGKSLDEIAGFYKSEKDRDTIKMFAGRMPLIVIGSSIKPMDFRGYRISGYKYGFGRQTFVFCISIRLSRFTICGYERHLSVVATMISFYYYLFISSENDSRNIERLCNLIDATKCFASFECQRMASVTIPKSPRKSDESADQFPNGEAKKECSSVVKRRTPPSETFTKSPSESAVFAQFYAPYQSLELRSRAATVVTEMLPPLKMIKIEHRHAETSINSDSLKSSILGESGPIVIFKKVGSVFEDETNEQYEEMFKNLPSEESVHAIVPFTGGRTVGIFVSTRFDDVYGCVVKSFIVENLTSFQQRAEKIRTAHSDIQLASSFLGIHKLLNETTLCTDSLSKELKYSYPVTSLLELICQEDISALREIRPDKVTSFRLRDSEENLLWYSAVCADSPSHAFIGYVFSTQELTQMRSIVTDYSITSVASDIFTLWSVDNETGEILSSICQYQLPGGRIQDIYNVVCNEDVNKFKSCIQKAIKSPSTPVRSSVRMIMPGYDIVTLYEVIVSQISPQVTIVVALNIGKEVETDSQLNRARELVDLALYHSNVVQWIFDDAHIPERVFASAPLNYEPLLLNWSSLHHNVSKEYFPMIKETFSKALQTGDPFEIEIPVIFEQMRWLLLRGRKSSDKQQLYGIYFDLTELKDISNQLLIQQRQAEEAASAKSKFLANMSHEIRTPLNGMFSLLELLLQTALNQEQMELVSCMQNSFSRLLELLNDTLDLAKIDQGKMTPSNVIFSTLATVEPMFYDLILKCRNKGIQFVYTVQPDYPILVQGDPHILSRIINNLLSNAFKFTERGFVKTRFDWNSNDDTVISVEDTGIGIPLERQSLIFENFTQIDSSITRPYGGSGIGLSLIKKMLKLINGSITFVSTPGKGSTFTVVIPYPSILVPYVSPSIRAQTIKALVCYKSPNKSAYKEMKDFYGLEFVSEDIECTENLLLIFCTSEKESTEMAIRAMEKHPNAIGVALCFNTKEITEPRLRPCLYGYLFTSLMSYYRELRLKNSNKFSRSVEALKKPRTNFKILVAEDNSTNQLVMDRILKKLEYPHRIVSNGREVINALENEYFDCILMDDQMPILNGPDAAREIRSSSRPYRGIPIIAMTASTTKEDEDECISSGMNTFISKPVSIQQLSDIIRQTLGEKTYV